MQIPTFIHSRKMALALSAGLCLAVCAALFLRRHGKREGAAVACDIGALSAVERAEQAKRTQRILAAKPIITDTPGGLSIAFASSTPGLRSEVDDWIERERRCCPFAVFERTEDGASFAVRISGPEGTKEIFRAAFEEHGAT